jgi:hypothetical protein
MSKMFLNVILVILALIGLAVIIGLIGAGSMMGGMMMGDMMGGGVWISLGLIVLLILVAAAIVWIFLRR